MKVRCIIAILAAFLLCAVNVLAQVGINATLSGTVSDTSEGIIVGVEVVATNTDTGLATTALTNESGTYRFSSLQPGNYDVTAATDGFQTQTFRLELGASRQIGQNFTLQVGSIMETVIVTAAADQLLTAATATVSTDLREEQITDLPLVGRNVMDLVTSTMPGVTGEGRANTTFAGVSANGSANVTTSVDGVTMNTGRHTQGLKTTYFVNPDMIDEMRVVVAPVDAEGRGAAQIQMHARSGTNEFHGAATWNVRNSVMNANTWDNNRRGRDRTWFNRHQSTLSLGGPVLKNKLFFFAVYDRNDQSQKATLDSLVLTETAKQGIFRFFPGVNNGNADQTPSGTGEGAIAPVVDAAGNPLDWTQIPGATGPMQSFNVFGDSLNPGDSNRTGIDQTGFVTRFLDLMPEANAFDGGDGLNTAMHRWVRRTTGGSAGFTGEQLQAYNRWQINIKMDYNINQNHRLSGSYVRENHFTDGNTFERSAWPTGFNGEMTESPKVYSFSLTSILKPTLLNEFRYGYRLSTLAWTPAFATSSDGEAYRDFLPEINGYPVYVSPSLFGNSLSGLNWDLGNKSPLTTISDKLSWIRGSHSFKFGVEFRYGSSAGYQTNFVGNSLIPIATWGAGGVPVQGIDTIPDLLTSNESLAENLLLLMAGSISQTAMRVETLEPTDTQYRDFKEIYISPNQPTDTRGKIRTSHQNEFNFFVKDDWQVRPNLTLNLGFRYDLFRVPHFASISGANNSRGPIDGNAGFFGISGRNLNEAFHSGGGVRAGLTELGLIGEGTDFPNLGIWPSDRNNFAPAVGFTWAPSFGGRDLTTIRGGYQISYLLPGNSLSWIDSDVGNMPGLIFLASEASGSTYRDLTSISLPLVTPSQVDERTVIPVTNRSLSQSFYSPDYKTPYIQTFTLGVTRSLPANMILDLRYVGTRGVQLHSSFNYNEPDFRNNGLLEALTLTRAGGDHPMFDDMLGGLDLGGSIGVVGGGGVTGSEALRRHSSFRGNLANGDFRAVANTLNQTNIGVSTPPGQTIRGATLRSSGLFPENFIVANPQFNNMEMRNNSDTSMYHSMQTKVTMRPNHGIAFQASWTWSRAMGTTGSTPTGGGITGDYRDFLNKSADYTLAAFHRTHSFRTNGIFELPVGPGRLLGGNTIGWIARLIEGWQVGTVISLSTGSPMNTAARNTINRSGTPDVVGDVPREGQVEWNSTFGNYFPQDYQRVEDPACANVAANLQQYCTNTAIADGSGNIILQNAAPGQLGTLGLRTIYGPGSWGFDANLQKSFELQESKRISFRLDTSNVFNHPTPGSPNLNLNSGTFGEIRSKAGNRTIAFQIRLQY